MGYTPWPPYYNNVANAPAIATTGTIDATGEKMAAIYRGFSGSIRRVYLRTGTVTTGGDVDVRIETVDGSGVPTGTLFGTNTNVALTIGSGDDNVWLETGDLTADAVITPDDIFAIVVVCGSPGNMTFHGSAFHRSITPYRAHFTVSWALGTDPPFFVPILAGGSYAPIPGLDFVGVPSSLLSFNTGTATTRRGNRFDVSTTMTVHGAWVYSTGAFNLGDYSVQLYDPNGTTVLATTGTIDGNHRANLNGELFLPFTSPVTLGVDTGYRLATVAESATNTQAYDFDVPAAAMLDMLVGRQSMYRSVYTSGNWVDTTTSRTFMGLLVDLDVSDGSPAAGSEGSGGGGAYTVAPRLIGRGGLL